MGIVGRLVAGGALLASLFIGTPAVLAAGDGAMAAPDLPATDDGTVYAVIGVAHSDLVLPRAAFANAPARLKRALALLPDAPWVIVGWGPYWFGRDEPGDAYHPPGVRTANLVWTLLAPQTKSRLRLATLPTPGAAPAQRYVQLVPVRLSAAGLDRAVARIDAGFAAGPDGGPVVTYRPPSQPNVAIFLSNERYSLAHECDHWVSEVLHAGGINLATGLEFTPAMLAVSLAAATASPTSHTAASNPDR